jgi:SOS-response transcriptional repressor LexA
MSTATPNPPSAQPTPRQREVLDAIRNYVKANGLNPTTQEIADALGVSKVTIFEHVGALQAKGQLRRKPHMARSIELVDDPRVEVVRSAVSKIRRISAFGGTWSKELANISEQLASAFGVKE